MPARTRTSSIFCFTLINLVIATLLAPTSYGSITCNGKLPTITSSGGQVTGTSRSDVILVLGSQPSVVNAGGGNDLVCTSNASDVIDGGAGNDTIFSSGGADIVNGGEGSDTLIAGDENDRLAGGPGNDSLQGGSGNDFLQGGSGIDRIDPGAGVNVCAADNSDPIVGSCTIDANSPLIANSSVVLAGSKLDFTWSASDLSGIADSRVTIGGPSGWVTTWCGFGVAGRVIAQSGNTVTFAASCSVPATAVNAKYTAFFSAVDNFGSRTESSVDFRIAGGIADSVAPQFSDISIPGNPFLSRQEVVINWRARDESGVDYSIPWIAIEDGGFADNSGRPYFDMGATTRISGDAKDGIYRQILIPNGITRSGRYTVWISSRDIYGNKEFIQSTATFIYP